MKSKLLAKQADYTMIQILVVTVCCFMLGLAIFHNVGMHTTEGITAQQEKLLAEQQLLEQEIRTLTEAFPQSSSFLQLTPQKKQEKGHKSVLIQKPVVDKKNYKYIKLENKLKVLIIHDPDTKMAQAALNVNVGSWTEPNEFPGLAHFLEHMLFQGSETYPQTSYFEQLIAQGGGYTNAYTEGMRTNYYFTIETSRALQALDVFAHFFIDPLLSQDMVAKEANAVNSEYEINVSGDNWKIMHLLSLMSDSKHPLSRFTIGNLDSLLKPHVVEALRKFHSEHYSSNQMALVVRSNLDISEMEDFLKQSEFKKIPNLNLDRPTMAEFGLPIRNLAQVVKYHINTRATNILYLYQLDDSKKFYKTKPLDFINGIVKSRHKGGLYDYLVSKKLVTDMDASPFLGGNDSFMFYLIEVELDETMIGKNKDYALEIGQAIISYFEELIKQFYDSEMNPTELLQEHYQSRQDLANVQFKYMEKEQDIFKLSHNLNTFPPENVLNAEIIFEDYQPTLIYNYLADLMNPSNMVILIGDDGYQFVNQLIDGEQKQASFLSLLGPETMVLLQRDSDLKFISSSELGQENKLYHIVYDKKNLDKDSLDYIAEDNIPLTLPPINHYIPRNLAFKSLCEYDFKTQKGVSYIQEVDSNTLYDRMSRQQIFIESESAHSMPFYFTSKSECKKHEMQYEEYNHFPQLIQKNLKGKTWWRLDRKYSPTVYVGLTLDTAIEMKSLQRQALLSVFNAYVSDSLLKQLQQSFQAGYELSFDSTMRGLSFEMYGWSDKFELFYKNVLNELRQNCNNDDQLQRIKTNIIMELQNSYEQKLFQQVNQLQLPQILQGQPTPQEMIEEINKIDSHSLHHFQKEVLKSFRFTSFFTGNVLREEVQGMTELIHKIFDESSQEIKVGNHMTQVADLGKKSIQYVMLSRSANKQDTNGLTMNYYQIGSREQRSYSIMNLLSKVLQNAAYSYLRTQLQLGYVVSVRFRPVGCLDSAQILVQGTAKPPYEVNQHIEEFLITYGRQLKQMSDQQFQDLKQTTIAQLRDQNKSLKDKARDTWSHIKYNDLAFEEREVAASVLDSLTKQEVFDFYDRVFNGGKLSLQIYGQGMVQDTLKLKSQEDLIQQVRKRELKREHTFAVRDEETVSSTEEFKQKVRMNFSCNYRISNI